MAQCGICLEDMKIPISIPCGHVHCEKCLRAHINSGKDALKSSCPSCRSVFHIVMPDLFFVPKKFHDFMVPSLRRLYMDIPSTGPLIAEIEQLKNRVATLSIDRSVLTGKCEAYRMEAQAAREATCQVQAEYDALKDEYETNSDHSLFRTPSKRKSRGSGENSRFVKRQRYCPAPDVCNCCDSDSDGTYDQ